MVATPAVENSRVASGAPQKNPDYLVDGHPTKVKTRTKVFGCGSFMTALDGKRIDHLTSRRRGRDGGSGFGTLPSA
jgi:hypothetical protein